jgi:hypothetical protein
MKSKEENQPKWYEYVRNYSIILVVFLTIGVAYTLVPDEWLDNNTWQSSTEKLITDGITVGTPLNAELEAGDTPVYMFKTTSDTFSAGLDVKASVPLDIQVQRVNQEIIREGTTAAVDDGTDFSQRLVICNMEWVEDTYYAITLRPQQDSDSGSYELLLDDSENISYCQS